MVTTNTVLQNRYSVTGKIGQGGMGTVYLATDRRFNSTVAIKESFFSDPNLRKAFEREATLLNRLRHPALPKVSDHFTEGDGQFLVMEYIAGEDLAEMLAARGGAFPISQVLGWADQLLDALDYLHTQELPIIHRDIKPQNLKLTARGRIVLLDFGLAKGASVQLACATVTGSVFGYSRSYAPLEQIQGTGTDPRSDLYALAATVYHLATGVVPPDALTRATAVLNNQPDPLQPADAINPQIPHAIGIVLARALRQNTGERPASAAAMREMLRRAEAGEELQPCSEMNGAPLFFEQETKRFDSSQNPHRTAVGDAARRTGDISARRPDEYVTRVMTPPSSQDLVNNALLPRRHTRAVIAASLVAFVAVAIAAAGGLLPIRSVTTDPTAELSRLNVATNAETANAAETNVAGAQTWSAPAADEPAMSEAGTDKGSAPAAAIPTATESQNANVAPAAPSRRVANRVPNRARREPARADAERAANDRKHYRFFMPEDVEMNFRNMPHLLKSLPEAQREAMRVKVEIGETEWQRLLNAKREERHLKRRNNVLMRIPTPDSQPRTMPVPPAPTPPDEAARPSRRNADSRGGVRNVTPPVRSSAAPAACPLTSTVNTRV